MKTLMRTGTAILAILLVAALSSPIALAGSPGGSEGRPERCDETHPGKGQGKQKSCEEEASSQTRDDEQDHPGESSSQGGAQKGPQDGEGEGSTQPDPEQQGPGRGPKDDAPASGAATSPPPEETQDAAPAGDLAVAISSTPRLVQIGDPVQGSATISNTGEHPISNVRAEVRSNGIDLQFAGGAGPVWELATLAAGETVELAWTGRATGASGLVATTSLDVRASGTPPATYRVETYLGTASGLNVDNPVPVVHREVTEVRPVLVQRVLGAPSALAQGSILPLTGWAPAVFVVVGLVLVALGVAILRAKARRAALARIAVVGLLILTACTAERPGEVTDDAAPPTAEGTADPDQTGQTPDDGDQDGEDDDDAEVLGKVVRPQDDDEGTAGTEPVQAAPPPADVGAQPAAEPVIETVTVFEETTRRERVPVDEIPVDSLGATSGANQISLVWDGAAIGTATSSVFLSSGPAEILTSLSDQGGALAATVTIENLLEERRLHLDGQIHLSITGAESWTLASDPIDVVLNPGGTATVHFEVALPAGSYQLASAFVVGG